MAEKSVTILKSTEIPLSPLLNPLPSIKLSFFDAIWIALPPIQRLLLYTNTATNGHDFAHLVNCLRSSLSSTLRDFLPLAGTLSYVSATKDVEIDLSNLSFVFVEADSNIDLQRLVDEQVHDTISFLKLVPPLDTNQLPCRVFSVQVTRFRCGGVSVGYSVHHAVADGKAVFKFVDAWARICKAKMNLEMPTRAPPPLYDRNVILHPNGDAMARHLLHAFASNLPLIRDPSNVEARHQLTRRTFVLDATTILTLKKRVDHNSNSREPTTFLAIVAHAWASFVRARSYEKDQTAYLCFLADCRTRLNPQIPDNYVGNCVKSLYANALVNDIMMYRACHTITESIEEMLEDPLRDVEDWFEDLAKLPAGRSVFVASSPRFKVYETDFGFGRPDRVELVSMNHDGEVVLAGGKEEGSVQVSVGLNKDQMDAYAQAFLDT